MKKQLLFGVFVLSLLLPTHVFGQNIVSAPLRVEAATTTGGLVDFKFKRYINDWSFDQYEITINGVTMANSHLGTGRTFSTTLAPNDTLRIYSSRLEDVEIKNVYPNSDHVIDHLELFGLDSCLSRFIMKFQNIKQYDLSNYTSLTEFLLSHNDSLQEVRFGPHNVTIKELQFNICSYNAPFDSRYLSGVEHADFTRFAVDSLNFSNMHHLRRLYAPKSVKVVDLSGCDSLRYFTVSAFDELDTFMLPNTDVLEYLNLQTLQLNCYVDIDMSPYVNLEHLSLGLATPFNRVKSIYLGNLPKLKRLSCHNYTGFKQIDLSGCPALEDVGLAHCYIETINYPAFDNLKRFNVYNSRMRMSRFPPMQPGVEYGLSYQHLLGLSMDRGKLDLSSELYVADTSGVMHRTRYTVAIADLFPFETLTEGVHYREEDGVLYFDKPLDGFKKWDVLIPKPYKITVRMENDALWCSVYKRVAIVDADSIPIDQVYVGIEPVTTPEALFYPNPTKDLLQFAQSEVGKGYRIIDMMGQIIMSGVIAGTIDVSALPSGSYMLGIAYEDRYRWHKLVKE